MIKDKKRMVPPTKADDGVKNKKPKLQPKEVKETTEKKNLKPKTDKSDSAKQSGKNVLNEKQEAKKNFGKANEKKLGKVNEKFGKSADKKEFNSKFGKKNVGKDKEKAPEKTDWRKFKQDKRDLKVKRKQSKDSYEISIEAKKIYEKLKCRRSTEKQELVEKLYNLISTGDTIKKLIMAHDTARIIQCMLKYASTSVHEELSKKLLPLVVEMSMSKYSQFCVLRMFKYGSNITKSQMIDTFYGNIVKLCCHNISSKILDHAYLNIANPKQKIHMRQEFYSDLYKKSKDQCVEKLSDTYKDTANMKVSILGAVKSNLEHVANKNLLDNSLVHTVLLEFLNECDEEKLEDEVTTFGAYIPLLVTTKEGCQASVFCFYKSSTKNRRAIIKNIKEHLVKMCTHEHGHIFVIALLNCLDDTKATKKSIYDIIYPELEVLMSNQYGRRVIEWLISPADTNCFHPTFIANIEEGLKYGKKDKETRRKEIFDQIEESIAKSIEEKPEFWLSDKHIALVTAEILKKLTTTHFIRVAMALTKIIAKPNWSVAVIEEGKGPKVKKSQDVEEIIAKAIKLKRENQNKSQKDENSSSDDDEDDDKVDEDLTNNETIKGIEEAGLHIVLKKIIKNDKERLTQNAEADTFGSLLVQELSEDTLKYWLTVNRACFVLLNIVENNNKTTVQNLKKQVDKQLVLLKQQKTSGAQLLYKKLI